jgi:hypothetical protein
LKTGNCDSLRNTIKENDAQINVIHDCNRLAAANKILLTFCVAALNTTGTL